MKYNLETDNIAQNILEMIQEDKSSTKIVNLILRETKIASFKIHKKIRPTRKAEITEDEAIFWSFMKMIENEIQNLEIMKINNKIFQLCKKRTLQERQDPLFSIKMKNGEMERMKINNKIFQLCKKRTLQERGDPLFSIKMKNGKMVETRERTEETILKHNEEILLRKPHSKEYEEIHMFKADIIANLLESQITEFKSLGLNDYITKREIEKKLQIIVSSTSRTGFQDCLK